MIKSLMNYQETKAFRQYGPVRKLIGKCTDKERVAGIYDTKEVVLQLWK